jgi:integrase
VHIIQDLLGHASPQTAEKFYTHAHAVEAGRLLQENVLELRKPRRAITLEGFGEKDADA